MAWKQALAKLKQDLKAEPEPAPAPKPKAPPRPVDPNRTIEDEDAMFLAAMGRRAPAPPKPKSSALEPPPPAAPSTPEPEEVDFGAAMLELKGMKAQPKRPTDRLQQGTPAPEAPPIPDPVAVVPPAPSAPDPVPATPPPPSLAPAPSGPRQIHLAAGMAIDVDGSLDLRAHSVEDARERLLERIQDGRFLGWRTLHVHLGPDPALRDMLLECIQGASGALLLQYAQAPVPMGGTQAWILYFPLA